MKGDGAATAEVMAFQCLMITLQSLMMEKEVPIEERLGFPVSQHVVSHAYPIPCLEKNLRSSLERKRKKEVEDWDQTPVKIARANQLGGFCAPAPKAKMFVNFNFALQEVHRVFRACLSLG